MKEIMIEDVLLEIREAEAKAEQIVRDAHESAKNILLTAETEADRLRRDTQQKVKDMRRQSLADAEKLAADRRNAILKSGADSARELTENKTSAVEEAADKIVQMLLEKY